MNEIEFVANFALPRTWSVELAGVDSFGRIESAALSGLLFDAAVLAPVLVNDYVPANCAEFFLSNGAGSVDLPFGVDTAGLSGVMASIDRNATEVRLTVFDSSCPQSKSDPA